MTKKRYPVIKGALTLTTINSSTSSSAGRVTGLASGLDTDTLVEDLTAATQAKIDKAKQQEQILEWKQEDYRKILTQLVDFNEEYFGTSTSSISIGDSLSKLTATSSNTSYVSVVTSDSSNASSVYISDIVSMATSAKLTGTSGISPDLAFTISTDSLSSLGGTSMKVTLDGATETITFSSDTTYSSADDVVTELNSLLEDAFGSGRVTASVTDGTLTLSAADNSTLSIDDSGNEGYEALDILGFADGDISSNRLNLSSTLSDCSTLLGDDETFTFSINGTDFSFANTTTLSKVISSINSSDANVKLAYSSITDTFTITSNEAGTGSNVEIQDTAGSFLSSILGGSGTFTAGTNAEVKLSLDGSTDSASQITITRNSNTFTIDGTTYTLEGMASGTAAEGVSITSKLDVDNIVEKLTQFVSDYNTLLSAITDKLSEERDSDYQPLTESEEEDLSDDEITTWTEQARLGWLRNDIYLTNISSSLRSSLYATVENLDGSGDDIGLIMADIGITTGDYTEEGQLTLDEDTLRTALAKDAEAVVNLFTQESSISYSLYNSTENKETRYNESGLLWRINDIIKANTNTVGAKGALISLVGNPSTGYIGTYTYRERLDEIDTKIDDLKDKLETEQDYYWSKFTAMETSLNSLSAQSSWLTAQTSS